MAKVKLTVIDDTVGGIILPYGDRLSATIKVDNYTGEITTNSEFWEQGYWKKSLNFNDSLKLEGDNFNVDVNFSDGKDNVKIYGSNGQGYFDLGEGQDHFSINKSAENFNGEIYMGLGDDKLTIKADHVNADIHTGSTGPFIEAEPTKVIKVEKMTSSGLKISYKVKDPGDKVDIKGDEFDGTITGSQGNYDRIKITGDNFNGTINDLESGDELLFKAPVYDGTISLNSVFEASFKKQMDNDFELYNSTLIGSNKSNHINISESEFSTVDLLKGNDSITAEGEIKSLSLKNVETLTLIDDNGFTGTLISNKATKVSLNDANHEFSLGKTKMKIDLGSEDSTVTLTGNLTGRIEGDGNNTLNISDGIYSKSGDYVGFNTIVIGENLSAIFNTNQIEKLGNTENVNISGTSASQVRGLSNWTTDGTIGDGIDDTFYNDKEAFDITIADSVGNSFDNSTYLFA